MYDVSIAPGQETNTTTTATNNTTADESFDSNFFDTYDSRYRFGLESTLALLATSCNLAVLLAVGQAGSSQRCRTSVYNLLFVNLSVVNVLSCVLAWASNNLFFLFDEYLAELGARNNCVSHANLILIVLIVNALGSVGPMTMVGFSIAQYAAIRNPLGRNVASLRRRKVLSFIALTWLASAAGVLCPLAVILPLTRYRPCDVWLQEVVVEVFTYVEDASAAIQVALYVTNAGLCASIYHRIRLVRREMTRFRFEHSLRSERRAFVTIVTLLVTLNVFFVPSIIVHVISLNAPDVALLSNEAVIYFMNMLPYLKYVSDPIIYGLRMRELHGCFWRAWGRGQGWRQGRREAGYRAEAQGRDRGTSMRCLTSVVVNVA